MQWNHSCVSLAWTLLNFHVNQVCYVMLSCADKKVPKTATNPEYFMGDKLSSKSPRKDYYNAPAASAAGVSRNSSRFNESQVWQLLTAEWWQHNSDASSPDLHWTMCTWCSRMAIVSNCIQGYFPITSIHCRVWGASPSAKDTSVVIHWLCNPTYA